MTQYKLNTYYISPNEEGKFIKLWEDRGSSRGGPSISYPMIGSFEKKEFRFLFIKFNYYKLIEEESIYNLISQDEVKKLQSADFNNIGAAIKLVIERFLKYPITNNMIQARAYINTNIIFGIAWRLGFLSFFILLYFFLLYLSSMNIHH